MTTDLKISSSLDISESSWFPNVTVKDIDFVKTIVSWTFEHMNLHMSNCDTSTLNLVHSNSHQATVDSCTLGARRFADISHVNVTGAWISSRNVRQNQNSVLVLENSNVFLDDVEISNLDFDGDNRSHQKFIPNFS